MDHSFILDSKTNKKIKWIEFDPHKVDLKNIDELLLPIADFYKKLEVNCVVQCCGIDAFSFEKEAIKDALINENKNLIKKELVLLRGRLSILDHEAIVSDKLNQLMHKENFIEIIDHIITNIE
ncbi:MAG: DUF6331 family protein [Bacteroidota bacterium]